MTSIDCLLRNTELVDHVKAAMEYIGLDKADRGEDASLDGLFNDLRKHGIEIDLGSAAHIYKDVLSTKDHPAFNTPDQVDHLSGRSFDDLSRNLTLQTAKGEKQISELSPAEAVVKSIVKTFAKAAGLVKDERTKSILRTMQDIHLEYAKKILGKLPRVDLEKMTSEQIIQKALDQESMGYTDKVTGAVNGFDKLHEGAKQLLAKLEPTIANDPVLKAQWEEYTKSFHDNAMTLIFNTKEGRQVLHEALMSKEGGEFVKFAKDGTPLLDYKKLMGGGNVGSIIQFRDNVVNAMKSKGYTDEQANKISDALQKEYYDLRGNMLDKFQSDQEQKEATKEQDLEEKPKASIGKIVETALNKVKNYQGLTDEAKREGVDTSKYTPELTFSQKESDSIMLESLKNSEYKKQPTPESDKQIDWTKMAVKKPDEATLRKIIVDNLKAEGIKDADAQKVADKLMADGIHDQLMESIDAHSKANLDARQAKLSKEILPSRKSEMTRFAELQALGIFNGAHDDLLHHVLGIDSADQQIRKKLMDLFQKKQFLLDNYGNHEFLTHSISAALQREVDALISQSIASKGTYSKIAKALYDYQAYGNMGIIANAFNIGENTTSGFQANLGQTLTAFKQMGAKEGLKIFYEMGRVWRATLADVAKGGIHYGIESGKFSGQSNIADKYTFRNWDKLNAVGKIIATATAYAHAGLNGMDSAYKVSIHQKTTMLQLHKALTTVPDEYGRVLSKGQANAYLNQHLFGKSLDEARAEAKGLYQKLGLPVDNNKIERSARELVQANIFTDGQINEDVVEAAVKSAYKVAAVGLGHEAREGVLGVVGRAYKDIQTAEQKRYDKLIADGKYNQAATRHIFIQTLGFNGVMKFAGGVANWTVLRPLTAGFGLVSGGIAKLGKSDMVDYTNKADLQNAMYKQAQANADINRALIGLSRFALEAGAVSLYGLLNKDEEDKDKSALGRGFALIKKNAIENKAMVKFGSDLLSMMYLSYVAKRGGKMEENYANVEGFSKYVANLMNVGQGYTPAERFTEMGINRARGTEAGDTKAAGLTGEFIRSYMPDGLELPFYRSYKGIYYLGKSAVQGKAELPPFYNPQSFYQGFLNTGFYNDIDQLLGGKLGMYPKDEGDAAFKERLRTYGM